MSRVAAIGSVDGPAPIGGFALVGVEVYPVDADDVTEVWDGLGEDVGLVILTPDVAAILGDRVDDDPDRLVVVTP